MKKKIDKKQKDLETNKEEEEEKEDKDDKAASEEVDEKLKEVK